MRPSLNLALGSVLALLVGCSAHAPAPARRPPPRTEPQAGARDPTPPPSRRASPRPRARPRAAARFRLLQWSDNATKMKGPSGSRFDVGCPAGGQAGPVWGTSTYTSDSSVCTAAVHAGLITLARGGVVTLVHSAGQPSYAGSIQNGVTSQSWGAYQSSFHFVGQARPLPPSPGVPKGVGTLIPWNRTSRGLRNRTGRRSHFRCPPGGRIFTVWGSSIYTDDSSICSAAVHAGYITVAAGGRVTVEMQSGQSSYQGSHRNGVRSSNWRSWTGSFIFVVPPPPRRP